MGTLSQELAKEGHLFLCSTSHTQNSHKMVDNVETTTPTVEEVTATNGESETATEEVTAAATENGTNGVHKETTEEKPLAPPTTEVPVILLLTHCYSSTKSPWT